MFKFPKPVSGEKSLTVEIPTPQLGNWVTLGALLTLSEPKFPICRGDNKPLLTGLL